jgi:hypothetical protein
MSSKEQTIRICEGRPQRKAGRLAACGVAFAGLCLAAVCLAGCIASHSDPSGSSAKRVAQGSVSGAGLVVEDSSTVTVEINEETGE